MRRKYEELRAGVEALGGSMVFERKGWRWGAWRVTLRNRSRAFPSNGRGFPELDALYVPAVENPSHWRDYTNTLVEGAFVELDEMLEGYDVTEPQLEPDSPDTKPPVIFRKIPGP
jgi:hypothetical protein